MQENGKLFSFFVIAAFVLMAFTLKSDRAPISQQNEKYYIDTVVNNVKLGKLIGNRNLAYGVRNVAEEALMDLDLDVAAKKSDASNHVSIEIVYFDIEQVKSNMSVFHKDANITVIRMRGELKKEDKVVKKAMVEEKSSEIAISSFIVSEGGGFNQQAASNALKKACVSLVRKLVSEDQKNKK